MSKSVGLLMVDCCRIQLVVCTEDESKSADYCPISLFHVEGFFCQFVKSNRDLTLMAVGLYV